MSVHVPSSNFKPVRRDRLLEEREHDTYKLRGKLPEPTVCGGCGAVFHGGRWQWMARPDQAHTATCPACQRVADDFPAGFVHLAGEFLAAHRDEITRLVRHVAEQEAKNHVLERLMAMSAEEGGLLVTTTGIHLARRLGDALHSAYQGQLDFHYNEAERRLRVFWKR